MRIRLVAGLLVLVAVVILGVLGLERTRRQVDVTAAKALSLTDETKDVVSRVRRPVRITAFIPRTDAARVESAALGERYTRLNRRISFRLRDPVDTPGEAQRLGIDTVFGGVALQMGRRVERGATVSEQDLTSGIARLLRGRSDEVCFTQGHGEPDPTATVDPGLSSAAALLEQNGYRVRAVDLLTAKEVPRECRAVVVANVTAPLGDAERTLASYLESGGRALVLTDPVSAIDPAALLRPFGMSIARGIVVEGDDSRRFPGDPLTPIVSRYLTPSPIARRLPPTFFPGAQAVIVSENLSPGLSVVPVAQTTDRAYLERDPNNYSFDPAADVPGPVTLVAAADLSGNYGGKVRRARVVVTGEADFVTNAHLGQAGNSRLFVQSLDWLTLDEDLVSVSANIGRVRPLQLTDDRTRYARMLTAGAVPALFVLMGAMVWAVRRGR